MPGATLLAVKNMKHTREQMLSIIESREGGKSNAEIAAELGVHPATITRWAAILRKNGRAVPRQAAGRKKIQI